MSHSLPYPNKILAYTSMSMSTANAKMTTIKPEKTDLSSLIQTFLTHNAFCKSSLFIRIAKRLDERVLQGIMLNGTHNLYNSEDPSLH